MAAPIALHSSSLGWRRTPKTNDSSQVFSRTTNRQACRSAWQFRRTLASPASFSPFPRDSGNCPELRSQVLLTVAPLPKLAV